MNEPLFASRIRHALDESAERLPYRVTQRLERARLAAVARAQPEAVAATAGRGGTDAVAVGGDDRPSGLVRLLAAVVPIVLVLAGLYGISVWDDAQRAAETADIDAELMLSEDEVPIAAYADRGFGVYIRNSRQ
jgi:hypothetical protein